MKPHTYEGGANIWIITSQKQMALPTDSGIDTLNSFKNRGVKGALVVDT